MPVSMLQKVRQNAKKDILVLPKKSVAGGLWTPSAIETQLWLDATDASTITKSGGLVSQWGDKSGKSRHFAESNPALQPTDTGNGIDFFINKGLRTATINATVRFVIVITKSRNSTWGQFHTHLSSLSENERLGAIRQKDNTGFHTYPFPLAIWEDGVPKTVSTSGFNSIQSPHIIGFSTSRFFSSAFTVGNYDADPNGGAGVEYETIALDTVPSDALRQQLEGYLAWKHTALGLVANLASDHPYKSAAPRS
jgi:hypothetical protein